jgi:hypothetical protein
MERPDIVTPRLLFQGSARYIAPVFQRYYTWGQPQLSDFFDDLDELSEVPSDAQQFLGAIVLQQKKSANPGAPLVYLMIDGQQRLTTIYLVLLGLAAVRGGEESKALIQNYLAINVAKHLGQPKVVPTAQDREAFYEVLTDVASYDEWNTSEEPPLPGSRNELPSQWERVLTKVRERVTSSTGRVRPTAWDRLANNILDRFEMVSITIEPNEDPNLIFRRLNGRGTPLSVADLVRNSVFSRFGHQKAQSSERFYHDRWVAFERSFPGKAGLQRYFQPFAVIRTAGKATQATSFPQLEERWGNKNAEAVLKDLEEFSLYFARLNQYQAIEGLSAKVNLALRDLAEMPKLSVSWPFMMQVLHAAHVGSLGPRDAERSLRTVESMLVRRGLMGWEPTGLHAVFKRLWNDTLGDPSKVTARVQTGTIKSPTDEELTAALGRGAVDRRKMLNYVLKQYERALRVREGTDEALPLGSAWIEHVLPQSHETHWRDTFTSEQHKQYVGLIGNLSLLTGKQNQKLQNQAWGSKRDRYATSDWLTTRELSAVREWDMRAIKQRTEQLTRWVLGRWPALPPKGIPIGPAV